ncbi:MAG: universal stress protein [Streptosporangiales bacterium]|nr:universal stress protein [Streptosporangiales bacterium]MBO0891219.1 universal stress protein [Acidothermales bacterium]
MTTNEFPRVVVGVDGTTNSLAALRHAALDAVEREAVLDVVHAVGRDECDGRTSAAALDRGRMLLDAAVAGVPETARVSAVRRHLESGEPADELLRYAAGAELLILGARTDPEHVRPLGGTTIPHVLAASPCEVLVCADHSVAVAA